MVESATGWATLRRWERSAVGVMQRAKLGLLPHVRRRRAKVERRIGSTIKRVPSIPARRRSLLGPAMPIRERLLFGGVRAIRVGAFVHVSKRTRSRTIKGWCPFHTTRVGVPGGQSTVATKGRCPVQTTKVGVPGGWSTIATLGTELPCRRAIGSWQILIAGWPIWRKGLRSIPPQWLECTVIESPATTMSLVHPRHGCVPSGGKVRSPCFRSRITPVRGAWRRTTVGFSGVVHGLLLVVLMLVMWQMLWQILLLLLMLVLLQMLVVRGRKGSNRRRRGPPVSSYRTLVAPVHRRVRRQPWPSRGGSTAVPMQHPPSDPVAGVGWSVPGTRMLRSPWRRRVAVIRWRDMFVTWERRQAPWCREATSGMVWRSLRIDFVVGWNGGC